MFTRRVHWIAAGALLAAAAWLCEPAARAQARRLIFEDIAVEGRVQKPVIDIFMRRQNLNTDYKLELRESFLPKIIESIEKKPF